MPSILHRISIDAPPEQVGKLVGTTEGVESWWTGKTVVGDDSVGGEIAVSFGDSDSPAATFEMVERTPERVVWRTVGGPSEWIDTYIRFALNPREDGGTTLLFSHEGWAQESEFMSGCSTNWGAYLMSLKSGAEGQGFNPFPGGEISRWS